MTTRRKMRHVKAWQRCWRPYRDPLAGERVFRLVPHSPADGSALFEVDRIDLVTFVESVRPRQQQADRPWIPATAHELLDAIQTAHEESR